ncbi:RBBP9/YdeN family alpha/beta hydrolase [Rhodoferax aquaticus]|uniref:Alpha/beta hydrolase n=1 Tax=Rhodoferax aquaticus TaxID=2527691 RepID=A0A515EJB2_9BURK|nr:alpha/beta fold hydrolase [Rhodoferax aquaticus]QDL52720.1 alpha/beta hydrolase [Rhodoferax aquaticus]
MTDSNPTPVLVLPGWQNSGPTHWQSRWEALYGYSRVDQHDWMRPLRGDWQIQLEEALLAQARPCVLAAHSLGCMLVAAWASHSRNTHLVQGALLVAPGDPEREALRPVLKSWAPVTMQTLPFKTVLLGSHDDPYCSLERAQRFAHAWGSEFVDYGARGHINADSGLGDWPEGHALLQSLR